MNEKDFREILGCKARHSNGLERRTEIRLDL